LDLVIQLTGMATTTAIRTDMVITRIDIIGRTDTMAIPRALRTTGTMGTVTTATIGIITTTATKCCRNLKLLSWLGDDFEPALFLASYRMSNPGPDFANQLPKFRTIR
jgi:hypothetical protein